MEMPGVIKIPPPETSTEHFIPGKAVVIFLAGFLMPILLWMPLGFISYARGTFDASSFLGMAVLVTLLACINCVPYLLYAMMIEGKQLFGVLPRKSLQRAYASLAIGFSVIANGLYFFWPEPFFAGIYFMVPVAGGLLWTGGYAIEAGIQRRAGSRIPQHPEAHEKG